MAAQTFPMMAGDRRGDRQTVMSPKIWVRLLLAIPPSQNVYTQHEFFSLFGGAFLLGAIVSARSFFLGGAFTRGVKHPIAVYVLGGRCGQIAEHLDQFQPDIGRIVFVLYGRYELAAKLQSKLSSSFHQVSK